MIRFRCVVLSLVQGKKEKKKEPQLHADRNPCQGRPASFFRRLDFLPPARRLLEIDVSSNKLSHLPPGFLHLSKLQKLTASKNYLEKLFEEESGTSSPTRCVVVFSIGIIFFFFNPFNFFFSFFSILATANWIGLRKLQELDLSDNKLTELPAVFLHSFKSLSCLNVSRNNLKVFPDAWACPLVSTTQGNHGGLAGTVPPPLRDHAGWPDAGSHPVAERCHSAPSN